MNTLVVASNNKHKIKEFKEIIKNYEILSLNDIGFESDIEENGNTFAENAIIKAKTIHNYIKEKGLNYLVAADDSGLCVPSLNNEPGIYSARYSGVHGDTQANRDKLLNKIDGKDRSAYFICTICLYYPNGEYKIFEGKTFGKITSEEIGKKDFGYDCVFYSNDLNKTFGEASEEEKNSVSHRGRAISEMLKEI